MSAVMSKKLNILVVDDDVENAEALAELLSLDNHDVTVAFNGQQAVDAYSARCFDVGFFDVMMPVKNGVESLQEIKDRHPHACVYFMTGFSADDLLERAKSIGARGIFSKPLDLEKMLKIVSVAGNA
jgi:DNA-binding NtrC family response regulator